MAWFKSWAAMTETEKRVADAEADRAEGISGIKGVVRAVVATSEDFGMGKNIKVERPSGADFERVLRVVQRSERKVGVLDDDTKKNVEDHLGSNPAVVLVFLYLFALKKIFLLFLFACLPLTEVIVIAHIY